MRLAVFKRKRPASSRKKFSACGRKKKFLLVHYFWAVLYAHASYIRQCRSFVPVPQALQHFVRMLSQLTITTKPCPFYKPAVAMATAG